jgi:uncharacterized protein YdhG (YjbR/CyaY superfamily)
MVTKKTRAANAAASDVDKYLAKVPPAARATLEKLRQTIKAAAPDATEVISYGMPIFKYQGMLVGFAAFTNHCSFFVMGRDAMKAHEDELKRYDTSKSAIRFPMDKPLPKALVKKLVKARIEENEARAIRRAARKNAKR